MEEDCIEISMTDIIFINKLFRAAIIDNKLAVRFPNSNTVSTMSLSISDTVSISINNELTSYCSPMAEINISAAFSSNSEFVR